MTPEQREAVINACEAFGEHIEIYVPAECPRMFERITAGARGYIIIAWCTDTEGHIHASFASDWPTHEEIRT